MVPTKKQILQYKTTRDFSQCELQFNEVSTEL